jgi:hemerythrin-like domain-containing protein
MVRGRAEMKANVKANVTQVMVDEHKLILRMISLVEHNTALLEAGKFRNWQFYLDAVDFIRNFADHFHHAKEEDVLFSELVKNGMPEKQSPIEAMHMEHDQGRAHVRAMEEAAQKALAGEPGQASIIASHAKGYAELLRSHIEKENDILYPLAERILPEDVRDGMLTAYEVAEAKLPGLKAKYQKLVEEYEQQIK